ncbi:terminase small subunit [Mesorhizobium sp. ASY16-5R]|uniref:terminase small subunit n=1 Tax=Mesorhizobium sp. ASY16-5R TaxID=3445772 RepID=UPI003FA16C05
MPILENPRHELFAQALAKGETVTDAYEIAGYEPTQSSASRLRADEAVTARVDELLEDAARVAGIDTVRVLKELGRLGFADLREAFDGGRLKMPEDWSDEFAASVASIKVVTRSAGRDADGNPQVEYVTEIKAWDKNSALEKIGKHLKMFVDRHELTGKNGEPLSEPPNPTDVAKAIVSILHSSQEKEPAS